MLEKIIRCPGEHLRSFIVHSLYIYMYSSFLVSLAVFSTKSRSAADLAEDFQERRGVNVKTNDSGCKEEKERQEGKGEEGENWVEGRSRGRKYPRCGAVTRAVAATRTMTIPFYFFLSSRFAQVLSISFISPLRPRAADPSPFPSLPSRLAEVYLNIFRDRAIHSYCSAFSIGFRFPKGDSVVIYSPWWPSSITKRKNMGFILAFFQIYYH